MVKVRKRRKDGVVQTYNMKGYDMKGIFSAETLYRQLGGGRFVAMTGAKNFVKDEDRGWLQFRIGRNPENINMVRIQLTPKDLYDMIFIKTRGTDYKIVKVEEDVGVENLAEVFTENTGLYTSL